MTTAERLQFKQWIEVCLKLGQPKSDRQPFTKENLAKETAIELYAVKSFQAQDMSGRFNRSRMNQAIKEAKPSGRRITRG
jgi:hypothetical protein